MKKIILSLMLLAGVGLTVKAQEFPRTAFSIGPELGFPSNSVYNIGYGASAKIEFPVVGKLGLSLTGGYSRFHYKSSLTGAFGAQAPSSFIPLKAGVRYGVSTGLYLEAEGGNVIETTSNFTNNSRNMFAFSIGPGFLFRISEKQNIDLGIRYEQWSKNVLKQTALRVAYRIGW
ncbi:outer membrane beta-barrel protein [Mucilaginibacter mali]|uniref:Outer membrane beta-barrel protein n=1 Tax=Mucilaginibacter mali TaxID=2740462 RepID=A0A7D4QH38_9SPHI|nr:outer membrane beta-barrel protein [Mucilaginibacter mali]QKJ31652.1 outer membrane beta-barrel protein [Mucilaginibacter mali]